MIIRNYTELSKLKTFDERYEYLKLCGVVGETTFGFDRYLNQAFYRMSEWRNIRNHVIARDSACDLGIEGYDLYDHIIIHHMNPVTLDSIKDDKALLLDPEFLICVSHKTHNAIHYGDSSYRAVNKIIERKPYDTCPWRR